MSAPKNLEFVDYLDVLEASTNEKLYVGIGGNFLAWCFFYDTHISTQMGLVIFN